MPKKPAPRKKSNLPRPARRGSTPAKSRAKSALAVELAAWEKLLIAREQALIARSSRQAAIEEMRLANEELVFATLRAESATSAADEASAAAREDRAALEREAELRERLMAIVGHDLRTPLASVLMASQYLLKTKQLSGRPLEIVTGIEHSALRMRDLIENLIELSRIYRAAGLPVRLQETALAEVCRAVVSELELARDVPGRFVCEFRGNTQGRWDSQRLAQIVSNLAGNALDHGDSSQRVLLRAEGHPETVVLEVHNAGAISEAAAPVLFEPFRRDSSRGGGEPRHLGLGLYIAHQLVRAHQGTVEVESSAERGTTFKVTLPRAPDKAQ